MFSRLVRPLSFLSSFIALAAMMVVSSGFAFAADPAPSETINSGNMGATGTFTAGNNALTLDGSDHTASIVGSLTVVANDFTGSGAGWTVTTSATPLVSASGGHVLATLLATSGSGTSALTCAISGSSCSTTNVTANAVPLNGSAQTLAAAATPDTGGSYGMGSYTFTDNVVADIPADTFAGTYSSTITLTMASA
jgi:hypothetical protein